MSGTIFVRMRRLITAGNIGRLTLLFAFIAFVYAVAVALWFIIRTPFFEWDSRFINNLLSAPFAFEQLQISACILISAIMTVCILRRYAPRLLNELRIGTGSLSLTHQSPTVEERLSDWSKIPDDRKSLVTRLLLSDVINDRIVMLRRRATAILIVIALALMATVLVVIFAGRLTSLDAAAVSNTDRLNSELERLEARSALLSQSKSLLALVVKPDAPAVAAEAQRMLEFIKSRSGTFAAGGNTVIPTDPEDLLRAISLNEKRIEETDKLLFDAWTREISSERGFNDWRNITATAITRVGVVLIIVFLVQILMGLYRYNTRLITFYASRKDIVNLWNGNLADLPKLTLTFNSPRVDFGKEPKHPLEEIIRAIGEKMPGKNAVKKNESNPAI